MSDIYVLNSGIYNGRATITPTDGYPAGQNIYHDGEGRILNTYGWAGPNIIENFDLLKVDISKSGSFTDGSDTISASNVSQEVFAANAERNYMYFRNNSAASMYVDFGVAATSSGSFLVSASGELVFDSNFVPSDSVNVICATSGAAFIAKEA